MVVFACSFGDYQLLYGREISKAELESLADIVQRQWHGFLELQSIARIIDAHRKVMAATKRGVPPPAEAVQVVLREAAALQWLPRSPEQVSVCTRRAKSMLQPYQRDLLPATLVAVASALAGDAKSKQDPRLAQVWATIQTLARSAGMHLLGVCPMIQSQQDRTDFSSAAT